MDEPVRAGRGSGDLSRFSQPSQDKPVRTGRGSGDRSRSSQLSRQRSRMQTLTFSDDESVNTEPEKQEPGVASALNTSRQQTFLLAVIDGITAAVGVSMIPPVASLDSTAAKITLISSGFVGGTFLASQSQAYFYYRRTKADPNNLETVPTTSNITIASIFCGFLIGELLQAILAGIHLHQQKTKNGTPQLGWTPIIFSIIYKTLISFAKTSLSIKVSPVSRINRYLTLLTPFIAGAIYLYPLVEAMIVAEITYAFCQKQQWPISLAIPLSIFSAYGRGRFEAKYTLQGIKNHLLQLAPHLTGLFQADDALDHLAFMGTAGQLPSFEQSLTEPLTRRRWSTFTEQDPSTGSFALYQPTPSIFNQISRYSITCANAQSAAFEAAMSADIIVEGIRHICTISTAAGKNVEISLAVLGFGAEGILTFSALGHLFESDNESSTSSTNEKLGLLAGALISSCKKNCGGLKTKLYFLLAINSTQAREHQKNQIELGLTIVTYPALTTLLTYPKLIQYTGDSAGLILLIATNSLLLPLQLLAINKIIQYSSYCLKSLKFANKTYTPQANEQNASLNQWITNHLTKIYVMLAAITLILCHYLVNNQATANAATTANTTRLDFSYSGNRSISPALWQSQQNDTSTVPHKALSSLSPP